MKCILLHQTYKDYKTKNSIMLHYSINEIQSKLGFLI